MNPSRIGWGILFWLAVILIVLIFTTLSGCGSGDEKVAARTECRTDANGRQICTTYVPKEAEQ